MQTTWLPSGLRFVLEWVMSVNPLAETASASVGQWLTAGFLLTMSVVIPVTGFLIRRYRTRVLFGVAMGLFSTGTLIAALAPGFPVLLAARGVQASGTAIMMPLLMTTVMTLVPPARRGAMMGNISIVIAVAPAIGPAVSGLVLSVLGWRFLFWLVLPIAVAVQNRITVNELAQTLAVYPSLSGSITEAARRLMAHDHLD